MVFYKKAGVDMVQEEIEMLLKNIYPEYSLDGTGNKHLYYNITANHLEITLKEKKKEGTSVFFKMRKRFNFSALWKGTNQVYLPLQRLHLDRYTISWAEIDQLYSEEKSDLGEDFLFLLDKEGKLSQKILEDMQKSVESLSPSPSAKAEKQNETAEVKKEELKEESNEEPAKADSEPQKNSSEVKDASIPEAEKDVPSSQSPPVEENPDNKPPK
jgi:hypothetical protein